MRRFDLLLKQSSELQALSAQAEQLVALQKKWEAVVPSSLRRHCRAGLVNNQRLTVYAASGAIAAKLKLLASGLSAKLQSQGVEITAIRVEVQVESAPPPAARKTREPGRAASKTLQALARSLPDSALRASLERLARPR